MRKEIEIRMSTDTTVHREYANAGFLGACRKLWRFWKQNGTGLDDYDVFTVRIDRKKPAAKVDDTRIFGYTADEFKNLPKEKQDELMAPLNYRLHPIDAYVGTDFGGSADGVVMDLPCTKSEYDTMSTGDFNKMMQGVTCHMTHPVIGYKFKDEA